MTTRGSRVGTPLSITRRTGYLIVGALLIAATAALGGPTTTPTATAATAALGSPTTTPTATAPAATTTALGSPATTPTATAPAATTKAFVGPTARPTVAVSVAATTTSPNTWCTDKASMDILGDSAATGYGVIDSNNHWVAKLRRAKPNTRVNTYAHNGAIVSDFLPGGRWPETTGAVNSIRTDQPSLVLVELGGNESYTDVDPAVYQANLEQLSRAIWAVSPRSTVIYETIWPFDPRSLTNPVHTWNEYATAMSAVAANHAARWIDLRPFFPAHYADDANTHLLNTDQIHPTDAGNAVEYTAILPILNGC